MNVTVNTTVSYAVNIVNVAPIQIIKDSTDTSVFVISFQWLDSTSKVIRQSNNRYTQTQLISASPNPTQTAIYMNAINTLFLIGLSPALRITPNQTNTVVTVQAFCSNMIGDPAVKTFQSKTYTEAELVTAGLSSTIIIGMIEQIATALTSS